MIGVGVALVGRPPARGISAGAAALIARMTGTPNPARQKLINTTYNRLRGSTYWAKLDGIGIAAAHDAQAGRLDWKSAARDLVVTGSPVHTIDRGYTGASSSNLSTGFAPSTAGGQYALNSMTMGFFGTLAGLAGIGFNCMGVGAVSTTATTGYLIPRNTSDLFNARGNDGTGISIANTGTARLFSIRRSGATARQIDLDGVQAAANAQASSSITAGNIYVLYGDVGAVSNMRCGAWFYGSYLTDAELLSLHGTLRAYLVAVGAV